MHHNKKIDFDNQTIASRIKLPKPLVFEGVLGRDICKEMQMAFVQGQPQARTFNGLLQPEVRRADFVILGNEFVTIFESFVKEHLEIALGVQCSTDFPHMPIIYRYPVGPGFKVHHDGVNRQEVEKAKLTGQPVMGGDITIILGVNDPAEYQGGELFFPNHDLQLKFTPGTFVAYLNTEEFLHGVAPITAGERYSVVCRVNLATTLNNSC